jgi:hypothetical protein
VEAEVSPEQIQTAVEGLVAFVKAVTPTTGMSTGEVVAIIAVSLLILLFAGAIAVEETQGARDRRRWRDETYYEQGFANKPLEWTDDRRELRRAEKHWKRGSLAAREKRSAHTKRPFRPA